MADAHFKRALFSFLNELKANNDKAWFAANKARYDALAKSPMLNFIADFGPRLERVSAHFVADPRAQGGSMFRIHRDTRFGQDKTPYKTHIAAHFRHAAHRGDVHTAGFYLHIEPGNSLVGAGIWRPDGVALNRIREAMQQHPQRWQSVLDAGPSIGGESLARVPPAYAKDHPFALDLKRKDFIVSFKFSDAAACRPDFIDQVAARYRDAIPLVRFVTQALDLPF